MALGRSRWVVALGLLLHLGVFSDAWLNERPVLEVQDGNLFITSAKDKNITFKTIGSSSVNINGINVRDIAYSAQNASQLVERWKLGILADMESTLARLTEAIEGPSGLQKRVQNIEMLPDPNTAGIAPDSSSNPSGQSTPGNNAVSRLEIQRLTLRVAQTERQIANLLRKLETDECASNPCQNGGTCEDVIDGYKCRCRYGWEGPQCNMDINECERFAGTDLGCHNGATCRNLPGSFRCDCTADWHGILCTKATNDCDKGNSLELCGHGVCVNKGGAGAGYTCICDQGWTTEGTNPACIKDVDECAGNHPPCSVSPMVPCINVPGTFYCGGCPAGYTGNGYYCADIDECDTNNGGCSTAPTVQCINTMGSRMCGACPPGYQGDGVRCSYVGPCANNNGGCHPLATCINNPGMGDWYVQCRCPSGYQGTGMGANGCIIGSNVPDTSACASNPCSHGTCIPNGQHDYTCRCEPGYNGRNCDVQVNPCDPNPCRNEGTCIISPRRTFVCRCTVDFTGPRCQTAKQSCGGIITDPVGTLQFPRGGNTYQHGLSCAWVLITNTSSVLNVTFSAFHLENSPDCKFDFLQIHDGRSAGEQIIGKYCGNILPKGGNIISTHYALYLWFRSDSSVSHDGFTLQWNSIEPLCGGAIFEDHGSISSPGSPGKYPLNRDCNWYVSVSAGRRIQFHFFTMMLEEHPTCGKDYLEIRDGLDEDSPQLAIYCNHTHPPPLITSGSDVLLHFHSDNSGQDSGFQITYSSIEGIPGCGGVYTAASGQITTPNFGSDYTSNLNCEWKIQVPTGERIKITWMTFDLESSSICRYDFVQVFDGGNREAPLLGRYCGETLPEGSTSTSNVLLIRFRSDHSHGGAGFKLNYEVWCGGKFTEPTGVLKSPYYPNNYPASRTCIYEIIQPPGKAITLTIQDLDIERYNSRCAYDSLTVRDGDNENSTMIGNYCGDNSSIPEFPIMSTHNYLWLKFKTDSTVHHRGFMATYETIDRRCGGILKTQTGIIQTPSEDGRYGNEEDCTWTIVAPPGFVVQLNWLTFDLEPSGYCSYDYIKIYENITSTSQLDMGTYCGSTKPPLMTSQSRMMTVEFHTDSSVTRDGFVASYVFVDASRVCGGTFHSLTGVINSPNYPNPYPANKHCEWIIQAPSRQQVVLTFKKFDLESGTGCTYDYLEVRNGGSDSSPLMGKYCGTEIPPQITSFGNQIYLKFKTDISGSGEGFNIEWDSTTIGCGGSLVTASGSIFSPNYPQPYHRDAECSWTIQVSPGSVIQLVIADLELETSTDCELDFVEIHDGPDTRSKRLGRYCQTNHFPPMESTSNVASIRFRSDSSFSGRGFHINYHTMCNNKLHGFRGVIESPNFPNNYPDQENCTWIIEAPIGNKLNVTFSHFDLEAGSEDSCSNDYLQVQEGESDRPTRDLGKFCDSTDLPPKIASTTNQIFLRFYSDTYVAHNGFRLEWVVNGCGGLLTRPEGTITSPGYPNSYPPNIQCEWNVEVDYLHSIEVTFEDVNMEKLPSCAFDKFVLYSGDDADAPKLIETCHSQNGSVFTSTGNKLFVKFYADASFQGRGFKLAYKSVDIQCGGKFTTPTGVIHSTNYPKLNYPPNQNCEWLIQVPVNHLVNLTFSELDIEDSRNCTFDYVRIYDGWSADAPILGTHCHNRVPPSYVASSNQLRVVMRTDSTSSAKGFAASYDLACGARIVTDQPGILSMDSTIGLHTHLINCTWTIVAQNPEDHVTFTMTDMRIFSPQFWHGECEASFVQVFEGDGTDGPSRGTWCSTKVPPPITSEGNALTIHASSMYGALYNTRFSGTYSVVNSACGGNYTSEHGTIATPGYPNSYPRNVECVWYLPVSPGNRISLTFTEFDLIESEHCNLDYVEVREESGIGQLKGVYCGQNATVITSSRSLWIKFRSNADGTKKGFAADYSLLHGGDLSGPSGDLASPLYPKSGLLHGTYSWHITVDPMSSIQITFKDFHIEQLENSCFISLTIYDGYDENAPELMNKCGTVLPEPVRSSSNIVYITFTTIEFREGSWFYLSWLQVPRESGEPTEQGGNCDKIIPLTGPSNLTHTFNSPGWPTGYDANLDCSWIFETPPGWHLSLRFDTVDLEETNRCLADHVKVFSGKSLSAGREWSELGSFCFRNASRTSIESSDLMKVTFHSDIYLNKTGFKATVRKVCGGVLRGPNGVIEMNYTTPTNRYWSAECQWNVTVRPGRTIEVKFITLDIGESTSMTCSNDYLMLKNGGSSSSPVLGSGKYCGNTVPDPLQTTGNQLYVKVSGVRSRIRLKLTYREVGMNCGGQIMLTHAVKTWEIKTPHFPNIPSPHTECFWTIMAPAGQQIMIHFLEKFDLTTSTQCDREYLEIRDGGTESSSLIRQLCGDDLPSSETTTGNMMYLHFYTDVDDPKDGFRAQVSIADYCGGTIRGRHGVLKSPNFPAAYPNNFTCTWRIVGPTRHYMKLQFQELDLPDEEDCQDVDHVDISEELQFNGTEDLVSRRLGQYCGSSNPGVIESSGNLVQVAFTSDTTSSFNFKGFSMNFSSSYETCGGILEAPEGEFKSPGYPNIRSHLRYCEWKITVPEGYRIKVDILDLDMGEPESMSMTTRRRIFTAAQPRLMFYNDFNYGARIIQLQAGSTEREIFSTSNKMMIWYYAQSGSNRGFRAHYSSIVPALCGGATTSEQGTLISDQNSVFNMTSFSCNWKVTSPWMDSTSQTLAVTVTGVIQNVRRSSMFTSNCQYRSSKVTVSDGASFVSYACGNLTHGSTIRSPSPVSIVTALKGIATLWSSGPVNFTMNYRWNRCGGVLGGPSQIISAPTNLTYPVDCAWQIKFPDNTDGIALTFNRLNLVGCDSNYIIVRNGGPSSPQLDKICGSILKNLTGSTNNLWIEYHAEATNSDFELRLETLQSSCGGLLQGNRGIISSPGFPANYPNNAECSWLITVQNGYHIGLVFTDRFNIETSNNCENDFLQVSDWHENVATHTPQWVDQQKLCGRNLPPPINSTSNKMKVLFRSNSQVQAEGFRARWNVNCGGIVLVTKQIQQLSSPGWPYRYGGDLNCNYTFLAPDKNFFVRFTEFVLEGGSDECQYDKVSIISQNTYGPTPVWCGRNRPPMQRAHSRLELHFKTDKYYERKGFNLEYYIDECGGEITESSDIRSPTMDDSGSYYERINCTWIVRAPPGKAIVLRFEKFHLEYSLGCNYDYVNVYSGEIIRRESRLVSLCGNSTESPPVVSLDNSTMTINFVTDFSSNYGGFQAKVFFTSGTADGCGGEIQLSENPQQFKTQKGSTYGSLEECHWIIRAPSSTSVTLTISEFDLRNATNATDGNQTNSCSGDYLEIRDGQSPFSELIGKYCGNVAPPRIISSSNSMWVRLVSDGEGPNGNGVTATLGILHSPCGNSTLMLGNETGILTSPNFPRMYEAGLRCRWKVIYSDPLRHWTSLTVHFAQFDLEDSENCNEDKLSISGVSGENFITEGFGQDLVFTGTHNRPRYMWMSRRIPHETYTYCGNGQLPPDFHSAGGEIIVKFTSSQNRRSTNHAGFKLEYGLSRCNRNFTSPQGRILHQATNQCYFTITAAVGHTISLYFNEFAISGQQGCTNGALQIRDGDSSSSTLAQLCGTTLPNPVFSSGNKLSLHSWGSVSPLYQIYDITYTTTDKGKGCGGKLYNYKGRFSSPLYPGPYRNVSECTWEVSVPIGFTVQLSFNAFDLGVNGTCATDFLEILDVTPNEVALLSTTYCGEDNPAIYHSPQGKVLVKYTTSLNNGGTGWMIDFEAERTWLVKRTHFLSHMNFLFYSILLNHTNLTYRVA